MKNKIRFLFIALPSFAIICSLLTFITTKGPITPLSAGETTYTLTFDKNTNHNEFEYSPFSKKITAKNYLDDDITFKYNRMDTYNDGFAIMSPDATFYNPFIESSKNYNALDGLKKIKVIYDTSTFGKLYLSYGVDEEYVSINQELQNGVEYIFDSYRPSHFKLVASPGEYLSKYSIKVKSIEFTYSSYFYYTEGEEQYNITKIADKYEKKVISPNSEVTYNVNKEIGTNNFFILNYHTNVCLKGKINFLNLTDSSTYVEEFFIEQNEEEFRTFLDAFRKGASGAFNKKIVSITLSNPNKNKAIVYLNKISIADRTYSRTDVKYISDSTIKLGISLRYSGAIYSLQNLNQSIVEYIDKSYPYKVKIRGNSYASENIKKQVATNPNLINHFDLGREIQQSYYFNVDEINGYTRGTYQSTSAQYNPVQCGDNSKYESKIVDYFATDTKIWIKVQAGDWAKTNSLTKSYMTNTYEIKNGLVYVNNTFVNWYGFTNYEENLPSEDYAAATGYFALQELPAVYINHPLNYYATDFAGYEIFDPNQGWNVGTTAIESISSASLVSNGDGTYKSGLDASSYHYSFRNHPSDWFGYFNEDKFGVAIYMPAQEYHHDSINRHVYVSGNYNASHKVSDEINRYYLNDNYETVKPTYTSFLSNPIESSKVDNVNYFASYLGFFPSEYTTLNWTYALGADYLTTLKTKFQDIKSSGEIYNNFKIWKGALI